MSGRLICISANEAWHLINFRGALITALAAEGYEVLATANADEHHQQQLDKLGARFRPVNIDNKGLSPFKDFATLLHYIRIFRAERPAAFLASTIKPNIYGSLAAMLTGVPVINTISGLGTAFIRRGWLTIIAEALYRLSLRRSHAIFFQNEADRDMFEQRRLIRPRQARLVPGSGIDLRRFAPEEESGRPTDGTTFLFIGRLLRDKGIVEFVEAAKLARHRHPNLRFKVLGFLNVANRTAIEAAAVDEWVAQGDIEFLNHVDDVRPYIASADCVVLPSYREGTSRVLLEAAAMGKPLIATDVPGCREAIDHGTTGYLCKPREVVDLAEAICRMASLPQETRLAMGRRGRLKMEREFDQREVIRRYIAAVAEIAPPAPQDPGTAGTASS